MNGLTVGLSLIRCRRDTTNVPLKYNREIDTDQIDQRKDCNPNQYASEQENWKDAVVECKSGFRDLINFGI